MDKFGSIELVTKSGMPVTVEFGTITKDYAIMEIAVNTPRGRLEDGQILKNYAGSVAAYHGKTGLMFWAGTNTSKACSKWVGNNNVLLEIDVQALEQAMAESGLVKVLGVAARKTEIKNMTHEQQEALIHGSHEGDT